MCRRYKIATLVLVLWWALLGCSDEPTSIDAGADGGSTTVDPHGEPPPDAFAQIQDGSWEEVTWSFLRAETPERVCTSVIFPEAPPEAADIYPSDVETAGSACQDRGFLSVDKPVIAQNAVPLPDGTAGIWGVAADHVVQVEVMAPGHPTITAVVIDRTFAAQLPSYSLEGEVSLALADGETQSCVVEGRITKLLWVCP